MAKATKKPSKNAEPYVHKTETAPMRPDVGTQPQFRKKKRPKTYRYDSWLSPALDWDGGNGAREIGEWLLSSVAPRSIRRTSSGRPRSSAAPTAGSSRSCAGCATPVDQLKRLFRPFLAWAGKAERLSFDVPTLPLFVHERLSTKAIVQTLVGHRTDKQFDLYELFGDPKRSIADQTLRAYEYQDQWIA